MRPGDIDAGGMEDGVPRRESDGDGTTVESHGVSRPGAGGRAQPGVMLIRIRPPGHRPGSSSDKGQGSSTTDELFAFHQGLLALGLPLFALRATDVSHPLPVPPVAVRCVALREAHIRSSRRRFCAAAHLLLIKDGIWLPTATTILNPSDRHSGSERRESETQTTLTWPKSARRRAQGDVDRFALYHPSAAVRRQLNKVFPTHWSFLLGEIATLQLHRRYSKHGVYLS